MKTKVCSKCKKTKNINKFSKDNRAKNKLQSHCKKCQKEWGENNPEKVKEKNKRFRENNPEYAKEYNKNYYQNNRKRIFKQNKKWREKNRERMIKQKKQYHQKNLEKYNERQKRFLSIPKNRLSNSISALIRYSLKGNKNGNHWEDIIKDYNLQELMKHLKNQFKPDMNWDNYGKWHIDHIKPISSFNFNSYNDPEFKECWALKNLRPLWAKENMSKGAKINK